MVASRVTTIKELIMLRTPLNACRNARKQQDSSVDLWNSKSPKKDVISVLRMLLLLVPTTLSHATLNHLTISTGNADGYTISSRAARALSMGSLTINSNIKY